MYKELLEFNISRIISGILKSLPHIYTKPVSIFRICHVNYLIFEIRSLSTKPKLSVYLKLASTSSSSHPSLLPMGLGLHMWAIMLGSHVPFPHVHSLKCAVLIWELVLVRASLPCQLDGIQDPEERMSLGVSMREFWNAHPHCGWHYSMVWGPRINQKGESTWIASIISLSPPNCGCNTLGNLMLSSNVFSYAWESK